MDSNVSVWDSTRDGISHLTQLIRDQCPGGLKGFIGLSATSILTVRYLSNCVGTMKTKRKIKARQAQAKQNIDKMRQRLDECKETIDESITEIPFSELQEKLYSGKLTCRQVLRAYQSKALELHNRLNCATEFILDAEEQARKLDALKPTERGMLHGIPISLKETAGVAGQDCTSGMSHFIGKNYKDYGIIVQVLIQQGAIPFVRTNICQALASYASSNPIYGVTCHPLKTERTCGGSSSGEGALIAGGGSILGVGCDMGGSNRVPSHMCGICGFKPTSDRMSDAGNNPLYHDMMLLREVFGPMGRDVASLAAYLRAALQPEMSRFDRLIPHISWREEKFLSKKPMTIGYYIWDGGLEPVPAVKRAVLKAKAVLEKMGHKVVEFTPPDALHAVKAFAIEPFLCDEGKTFSDLLKHEIIDHSLGDSNGLQFTPYGVRWILSKLLFFLHPVQRKMLTAKSCGNVYNWWKLNESKEAFRRHFIGKMEKLEIEAIICPTLPFPAWPLDDDSHSMASSTYPMLYNAVDFPCGSVPVTHVNEEDVKNMASYPKHNIIEKYVHRISEGSQDLPIGVQVVGFPYEEEIVLRVMKDIETGLKEN